MKKLILAVLFIVLISHSACTQGSSDPFNIRYYGNFKNMVHQRKIDGVVDLKTAVSAPHTYAVGAIKKGEGEITVHNSEVWLSYGKDGLNRTTRTIPESEQALLLVTAQVENWQEIVVPKNMSQPELYKFIIEQAEKYALAPNQPFPFLLEGRFQKLLWHVINGLNPDLRGHERPHLFNQLTEQREQKLAIIVGFYSGSIQGVFTHPGDSWHLHVLFSDEKKAGHVDEIVVQKDTVLKLPVLISK